MEWNSKVKLRCDSDNCGNDSDQPFGDVETVL